MKPKISDSEWKVMEVVWEDPPVTANDVMDAIGHSEKWKLQTVKTLIGRLVKKDILSFQKNGNQYFYTPELDRDTAIANEAESFIGRISRGSIAPLFAHLVESQRDLSKEELASLRKLLKDEEDKS